MPELSTGSVAILFTDIEGSARLWEQEPERMRLALARHDVLIRTAVKANDGIVVKMTGDGVCATFGEPPDAIAAALALQKGLVELEAAQGIALRVRCGLHFGSVERRDNDVFGTVVNRAARIMAAAHGGQVLLSGAIVEELGDRVPEGIAWRDLGSVRLRDLARPERVYQLGHPQLRREFPALRSLEATANNLPQQISSFVGREQALAEARVLLGKTRLLTLQGVGGLGKTRLSLQLAADVLDEYPDGAWFVELAPLSDARLVAQAVATALGVKEEPGTSVTDTLQKHVRDRHLLLILDNCEHLLAPCAELARHLLESSPRSKVLASSREPLHVSGETTYRLPTLSLPPAQLVGTRDTLAQFEATRLFIERATAARPDVRWSASNVPAVAAICRRLDGIPLALELAAARVRTLSIDKIAERLADRFRLLKSGDSAALPRQQTLRACIDWSHELLAEPEQALLRRLAVFAGDWTLEAAEAVGTGGHVRAEDVLDLLIRLVEKSLVEVDSDSGRYRLLETIRQYAWERLGESSEKHEVRARHLTFYVALAEKARPQLVGPEQGMWLARLDLERENLLAAHRWCDHGTDGARLGLRLVIAVQLYWRHRGLLELGNSVTGEALARTGTHELKERRWALYSMGQLGQQTGRNEEARRHFEEGLSLARQAGDKQCIADMLRGLGRVAMGQSDVTTARRHFDECLGLERELNDAGQLSDVLNGLAELHRAEGDLDAAEPLYEEALAIYRRLRDRANTAIGLLNLAIVALGRGNAGRARTMLREVLAIRDEIGSKYLGQAVLDVAVGLGVSCGEFAHAARFFGMAQTQLAMMGGQREPVDEAFLVTPIARTREALGASAFAAAEAGGRELRYEDAIAEVRGWLERPS